MNDINKLLLASLAVLVQELEDIGLEAAFELKGGCLVISVIRRNDMDLHRPALVGDVLFFIDVPMWDYEDDQDALSSIFKDCQDELKNIKENNTDDSSDKEASSDDEDDDEEFF